MDLPLYLFLSPLLADYALLPSAPQAANSSSYSLFLNDPVAFTYQQQPSSPKTLPLTTYWSESRSDYQTTTVSLSDINDHGGDYIEVPELFGGYILSSPETSPDYFGIVPISLAYSDTLSSAITAPWAAADVNIFVPDSPFRDTSTVLGYAGQGNCTKCSVKLSETFPSAGGADCPVKCEAGTSSSNAIYRVGSDSSMGDTPAGANLLASMKLAGSVVKEFDDSVKPEVGGSVHVSFEYFCCQTAAETATIDEVLKEMDWTPQNVTFDRVAARIDNPESDGSVQHYSICLFLDEASNQRMLEWVGELEERMEEAGVVVNVKRKNQEPYHSTLAVVNGATYPVEEAIRRINELIPPGSWTGAEVLQLTKPQF